jgi:hypothetical protein
MHLFDAEAMGTPSISKIEVQKKVLPHLRYQIIFSKLLGRLTMELMQIYPQISLQEKVSEQELEFIFLYFCDRRREQRIYFEDLSSVNHIDPTTRKPPRTPSGISSGPPPPHSPPLSPLLAVS